MATPTPRTLLIGALLGLGSGLLARVALGGDHAMVDGFVRHVAEPGGRLFLRLLLAVVVPLVFCSVTLGIVGLGALRRVGKLGAVTFGLTLVVSAVSVGIGLAAANIVRPGEGLPDQVRADLIARYSADAGKVAVSAPREATPAAILVDLLPRNPLGAATSDPPDLLGLLLVAALLGAALLSLNESTRRPVTDLLEGIVAATTVVVGWAMALAPVGVGLLLFALASRFGFDLLLVLARFAATVIGALGIHFAVVYSALLMAVGRSPVRFWIDAKEALLVAFATSSSNATLPTALRVATERLAIPAPVASFVLTVGATANQNGTALFEGVAVLFLAQVFGVNLTMDQQVSVMAMALAAGVGTAGVPSASLPFVALVLGVVGVPAEALALLLGVDRILDMCRTTINVAGDLAIAAIVTRFDGGQTLNLTAD